MRKLILVLSMALVGIFSAGCGSEDSILYIKTINNGNPLTITVGQIYQLTLNLSQKVTATTYVELDDSYPHDVVAVDPSSIKFKEGQDKATTNVTGLAPSDGDITLVFNLKDNKSIASRLYLRIADGGITPTDSGIKPVDTITPSSDAGLSDSTNPTEDQAIAADMTATE